MNLFYLWVIIAAIVALWAQWVFGFRTLIIDRFRFEIGDLLLDLEDLVATGCLSTESTAYKTLRAILEGLIVVAPKFSLSRIALSQLSYQGMQEPLRADSNEAFDLSVASLQPYAQNRLRVIRGRMALLSLRFVLLRTPLGAGLAYVLFFIGYITGRLRLRSEPVEALQREAYASTLGRDTDHVLA